MKSEKDQRGESAEIGQKRIIVWYWELRRAREAQVRFGTWDSCASVRRILGFDGEGDGEQRTAKTMKERESMKRRLVGSIRRIHYSSSDFLAFYAGLGRTQYGPIGPLA